MLQEKENSVPTDLNLTQKVRLLLVTSKCWINCLQSWKKHDYFKYYLSKDYQIYFCSCDIKCYSLNHMHQTINAVCAEELHSVRVLMEYVRTTKLKG